VVRGKEEVEYWSPCVEEPGFRNKLAYSADLLRLAKPSSGQPSAAK
jgi:hypothetical protein